jgi:hypothetical protein
MARKAPIGPNMATPAAINKVTQSAFRIRVNVSERFSVSVKVAGV